MWMFVWWLFTLKIWNGSTITILNFIAEKLGKVLAGFSGGLGTNSSKCVWVLITLIRVFYFSSSKCIYHASLKKKWDSCAK